MSKDNQDNFDWDSYITVGTYLIGFGSIVLVIVMAIINAL